MNKTRYLETKCGANRWRLNWNRNIENELDWETFHEVHFLKTGRVG
jgi:hypothetical protein